MTSFIEGTLGINIQETIRLIIPILITFLICKIAITIILKILKKVLNKEKKTLSFMMAQLLLMVCLEFII